VKMESHLLHIHGIGAVEVISFGIEGINGRENIFKKHR